MIKKVKGKKKPLLTQGGPEKIGGCICPCDCNSPGCTPENPIRYTGATIGSAASWFWGI